MARRTKADAEVTREKILDAACCVFVRRGVTSATLEEIAEEAGVTRGAVYWHFKNKTDLFQALHERLHVPFTEMMLQDLQREHPDPLLQLEELCVRMLEELEGDSKKKQLLTILFMRCDYSGEMEAVLERRRERRAENFPLFDQYFERAKAAGHLPADTDPQVLTLALFCYLSGIVLESIRDPDRIDLRQHAGCLMKQFFRGFLNHR